MGFQVKIFGVHWAAWTLALAAAAQSVGSAAETPEPAIPPSTSYKNGSPYRSGSTFLQRYLDDLHAADPGKFNAASALSKAQRAEKLAFELARRVAGLDQASTEVKEFFDSAIRGAAIEKGATGQYRISQVSIDVARSMAEQYRPKALPAPAVIPAATPEGAPLTHAEGVTELSFSGSGSESEAELARKAMPVSNDPDRWLVVNQDILPVMREDFKRYFATSKPGDVKDWAGGKLHRNAQGALFVDDKGRRVNLSPELMNFNDLALRNSAIAAQWKQQYGFQPIGVQPTAPR